MPDEIDFYKLAENLRNRNKFLNGKLYLDSRNGADDRRTLGSFGFNLFYMNLFSMSGKLSFSNWSGLCSTRVLQYLHYGNDKKSYSSLLDFLVNNFDYQKSQIDHCIILLKTYGYIDTKFTKSDEILFYEISEKGVENLKLVYSDIDVLYYLCIDTQMPSFFFDEDLIKVHDNKILVNEDIPVMTNYRYSACLSTVVFILFLIFKDFDEQKGMLTNPKHSLIHIKNAFRLPFGDNVFALVEDLIKKMTSSELEIVNGALEKLINCLKNDDSYSFIDHGENGLEPSMSQQVFHSDDGSGLVTSPPPSNK
ncbi:MAG: hypothetical protein IPN76_27375 [Saprospiraceae bacterium]|nr:hypothetical protein [Saprospiraceae bacterium]